MAHHIIDFKKIDWIKNCQNCILIRHPKEVINSFAAKNDLKSVKDLGYPQQFKIIKFLKKQIKHTRLLTQQICSKIHKKSYQIGVKV